MSINNHTKTEQTVAYYPYGSVIADLGTGSDPQPFKFGGKELTLQNGLNEYDFGARQYYPAVPHFTGVDPLCEKYYWLSPYLYCGNNPVNLVDMTGEIPSEEEAARMADYVYGKENIKLTGGWKKSGNEQYNLNDKQSGIKSMLFEREVDGTIEYAYAFAGTDPLSIEDWENNITQLTGTSEQYSQAISTANNIIGLNGELTFVGHSLGGGLAAAAAFATNGSAMTFNAAGVSSKTINTSAPASIDAFITYKDELNVLQRSSPFIPAANGKVHWRNANSCLMGHDIKNFYQPSIYTKIYNGVQDIYMNGVNYIKNILNPVNLITF